MWFHLYGYCLLHIRTPISAFLLSSRSPFLSFSSCRRSPTPLHNVIAAILTLAVSYLHEGEKKRRKVCADTVGHFTESVPSLQSLEK